jgi:hypothetical protein
VLNYQSNTDVLLSVQIVQLWVISRIMTAINPLFSLLSINYSKFARFFNLHGMLG